MARIVKTRPIGLTLADFEKGHLPEKRFIVKPGRKNARKIARANPFIEGGYQTIATGPSTRAFALRHPGISPKATRALIDDVASIRLRDVGPRLAQEAYSKQTAENIFRSRQIPVAYQEGKLPSGESYTYPAFGCNSQCVALTAALRAKHIPAAFIRLFKGEGGVLGTVKGTSHAVVLFNLGGMKFIGDPFARELGNRMLAFTPEMQERFSEMEKIGSLSVGRDAWDLGITAYGRYHHIKKTSFFQSLAGKQR